MEDSSSRTPVSTSTSAPPGASLPAGVSLAKQEEPSSFGAVDVSVIVPALNEADNLPSLVRRIAAALSGQTFEIIVVDDNSPDATKSVCETLCREFPLRLLVREHPCDGLGGAVLHGIAQARGRWLVVMDADLQHPPEALPALLDPLARGEGDFVIGSRYVPGGTTEQRWGLLRRVNSGVATFLARPFSGKTHDPMSGFFALSRATFDRAQRLTPLGYKIGLELMCKCRVERVREIPIHFGERVHGRSKLNLRQQFRYLEHLSRLYDFTFPRASPFAKFAIATGCGWGVALALYVFLNLTGIAPTWAPILSYPAVILVTAVFHLRYVRTQRPFLARPRPWKDFTIISMAEWMGCALSSIWATWRIRPMPSPLELFLICFGVGTVVRYILRKEFLLDIRGLRRSPREDASPHLNKFS